MPRSLVVGLDSRGFCTLKDAAKIKAYLYLPRSLLYSLVGMSVSVSAESGSRGCSLVTTIVALAVQFECIGRLRGQITR